MRPSRRTLLRGLAGFGLAELSGLPFDRSVSGLLQAADAPRDDLVRLDSELEPLVRRIEATPREKCFGMITDELRRGLSHRRFLAALFLAGVRNVNPQPPGFDLHCVFAIHAAHQLSLDAVPRDRLLPLYWALDEFKDSQAADAKKNGDYAMRELRGTLPSASRAWSEFHSAMNAWDIPQAERAVVALCRQASFGEIFEALWLYGARDFRNIGHKAIYVANAKRTLETIGLEHAEPVLRSVVVGLLDFGRDNRVNEYAFEDQCYTANAELTQKHFAELPAEWTHGPADEGATLDLLAGLREADVAELCLKSVELLRSGRANAAAVWDSVHLVAGEQMMRQPGIVGLHAVTSVNALHTAFERTTLPKTRLLLLLQAVGWVGQFHHAAVARKEKRFDVEITKIAAAELPESTPDALEALFSATRQKRPQAAAMAITFGQRERGLSEFAAQAAGLITMKTTDPHGYKYPVAVLEDYHRVSPRWRGHVLATGVYNLPGTDTPDAPRMQEARDAIRTLG